MRGRLPRPLHPLLIRGPQRAPGLIGICQRTKTEKLWEGVRSRDTPSLAIDSQHIELRQLDF